MVTKKTSKKGLLLQIQDKLKTVYDPEFPMIDMYTLGLIYKVDVLDKEKKVNILMTFTTPACPMADMIQEMVTNAILEVAPNYKVEIDITFDPMWTYDMIQDEDLKKMFE